MKITYDKTNNYYIVNDTIIIDIDSYMMLAQIKNNKDDNLQFINNEWYLYKYKSKERLIDILFPNEKIISYNFLNNNIYDYQKDNIQLVLDSKYYDKFNDPEGYTILKYGTSHKITHGKYSEQYRNMYWKVQDCNNDKYYLMHITKNIYTKISKRDISKVLNYNDKRPFWYFNPNGYIATTISNDREFLYLHQYIMDVHTEDLTNFEKTVDHINRDKLDNRRDNLRFANMSIQNENRDKAARRCDAKTELPDWLGELPKYVQYRQEIYDKTNNLMRDFFVINHPSLDKIWESSKSMNIHLKDKFKATKLKLELLNNIISEQKYNKESGINDILDLPIGVRLIEKNNKYQFVLDYRKGPNRYNLKKVISSQDIQNELKQFIDEINTKYHELNYMKYTITNINAINNIAKNIVIIEKVDIDIAEMKKDLPPNFFIITEKNTNYLSFTKTINRVKYNMKKVIKSNNLNSEIENLINCINDKYKINLSVNKNY
jgi:hypothetical protein